MKTNRLFIDRAAVLVVSILILSFHVSAAKINELDVLPRPELIFLTVMKDINGSDTSMSDDYWKAVDKLCIVDPFPKSLCVIPPKVKKLNKLMKKVFARNGDVLFPDDMGRRNNWDIRELTAANFAILPSPEGPEQTLKAVADIFVLRNEILRSLLVLQSDIKKHYKFPSENMLLTIPFIRASIYSASPLGAALTIFNTMKCTTKETLCDLLKSRQGAVINVLLQTNLERISNFQKRIEVASNDEATEQSRRLRLIMAFAEKVQNDQRVLKTDDVMTDIDALVGSGQSAYVDTAYQEMARLLIIMAETNLISNLAVNFSVYSDDISLADKKRAKTVLMPLVNESLDAIDLGLITLGLKKEMGE